MLTLVSTALSMSAGAMKPPGNVIGLDPLALIQDKNSQAVNVRPYAPTAGLEVATIGASWFWHPEGALAGLPGVYRTAVGYCGGIKEQPSYWKVCNDDEYDDYVEAVTIDYDPTVISYSGILDAFFHIHDAVRSGRSRQYASAIFTHNNEQAAAAAAAVEARRGVSTVVEAAGTFWEAETYHQKWLLQRKRPLFLALGMQERHELLGAPATVLNAAAAGKLPADLALSRLEQLVLKGELSASSLDAVARVLAPRGL